MTDRDRTDALARALAEELTRVPRGVVETIGALQEPPPWGPFNVTALAHNDDFRDMVFRAVQSVGELRGPRRGLRALR